MVLVQNKLLEENEQYLPVFFFIFEKNEYSRDKQCLVCRGQYCDPTPIYMHIA